MTFVGICRKSTGFCRKSMKNADILCIEDAHASWSWPYVVQNRDKSWGNIFLPLKIMTFVDEDTVTKRDEPWSLQDWPLIFYQPLLLFHLLSAPVTFRSCSPHFTVKLWFPQMLPNFGYGRQIMHTDVKKQGLPQMSANRPSIWFTGPYFTLLLSHMPPRFPKR